MALIKLYQITADLIKFGDARKPEFFEIEDLILWKITSSSFSSLLCRYELCGTLHLVYIRKGINADK